MKFFLKLSMLATIALLAACDKSAPPQNDTPASSASTTTATVNPQQQTVRASGSSALGPLVNAAKEKYEAAHPGASIEVSAGGSKKGLSDVSSGASHIGSSDIFAAADQTDLVDHKVAVVGFAAMANKGDFDSKVTALTQDQLAKIFSGEIKDWKEVGGSAQPIVVINRAAGSGTRAVFGSLVLGGDKFVESQTEDNSGALVAKLKQTKGAISYLALSFADADLITIGLKNKTETVVPATGTIESGAYPIWSYEHMYTKGEPTGSVKDFLDYVQSAPFQNDVLPTVKGFIPVTAMKVTRTHD